MPAEPYLVAFVADAATDEHAAELAELARLAAQLHPWAGAQPRFFDQTPMGSDERTVGVHLRVAELADGDRHAVAALIHALGAAGARLGARIEVQLAEEPVGVLSGGLIDDTTADALRERLGVEI